ncbi:hypothetical protein PVIIG_06127 [Plasmodium vivax India VII]|uniref:Uncharacterized protein n=3 Tax=Plasmodium vivax TaxID=5855 RepID=A0A0J9W495_PLAVI|nr:hypothetical protein PVIIG_06127 [Plasmodium vivax India VII]KMZ94969.1 hypothetical protein PVMG_05638 [Plasmodium vivax Mauritania I]KMZ95193.1 hypothetical protein PVMG_05111 [Plasmodium vivax Mauritania I]KNA01702.1 hypothetical protein PVNG_04728 [Plasmodium vivax North Korean]
MLKLYDLYNTYEVFHIISAITSEYGLCTNLVQVVNSYNSIINDNGISAYLFKKLKYIKFLVERLELMKSGECRNLSKLLPIKKGTREETEQCIDQGKPITISQGSVFQQVVDNQEIEQK